MILRLLARCTLVVCVFEALALRVVALSSSSDKASLIGWKGATFDEKVAFKDTLYEVPPRSEISLQTEPVQISKSPLAWTWRSFLTRQEARHIVELAAPRMLRSQVGGEHDLTVIVQHSRTAEVRSRMRHTADYVPQVRTSYGMFIHRNQDAIVAAVQRRVAAWLQLPVSYQEDMQILRYSPGQRYKPHMDSNGRMCTVLVYLTAQGRLEVMVMSTGSDLTREHVDVGRGGETAFPNTSQDDWLTPDLAPPADANVSECARGHVHAVPRLGDALLFYSLPPGTETLDEAAQNATAPDHMSMHTGCAPAEGELKWTATFWVHFQPFRAESYSTAPQAPLPDPGECANYDSRCDGWAKGGECDKNPGYMRGSKGSSAGQCRLACGLCTPCVEGNTTCFEAAREEQGYLPNLTGELQTLYPDL